MQREGGAGSWKGETGARRKQRGAQRNDDGMNEDGMNEDEMKEKTGGGEEGGRRDEGTKRKETKGNERTRRESLRVDESRAEASRRGRAWPTHLHHPIQVLKVQTAGGNVSTEHHG